MKYPKATHVVTRSQPISVPFWRVFTYIDSGTINLDDTDGELIGRVIAGWVGVIIIQLFESIYSFPALLPICERDNNEIISNTLLMILNRLIYQE